MKVTYLYHSGFAIELQNHVLIFDYYKGELPKWDGIKTILFFASHKHQDHFNLKIFDYFSQCNKCHYFLGSDIKLNEKYLERKGIDIAVKDVITNTQKNASYEWNDIKVETLRSTDAGVAFIVTVEGKTIYHGGDLNWWHWEGENPAENRQMEKEYKHEISLIEGRCFDVAFVPLDPRLEKAYSFGMQEFLARTKTKTVFPMHMWDQYEVISRFSGSPAGMPYEKNIMKIKMPGEEFVL